MKTSTSEQSNNLFLYTVIGLIAAVIVGLAIIHSRSNQTDPRAPSLAACISKKGLKFYGASWCPHCAEQKSLFGSAAANLPYVECAGPDNQQTAACDAAGIKSYPTWITPDNQTHEGVLSIDQLYSLSGCTTP